jgi:hypothetical protein
MLKCLFRSYAFIVIEFEHAVEQVEGGIVMYLTNLLPLDALFLHLVRDQASVPQLKRNFLDVV